MLSELLKIYTYHPFESIQLENFVKKVWSKKSQEIHEEMIFVGNAKLMSSLPSLLCRYPVYYGRPMTSMYSERKLSKVLKGCPKETEIDESQRYVWGGPVDVMDENGKCLRKNLLSYVFHTWGVNLESKETYDYNLYVKKGRLQRRPFKATVEIMLNQLLSGVGMIDYDGKDVHIVIPQLGQGAFLSSLESAEDVEWIKKCFLNLLAKVSKTYSYIQIHYCLFDNGPNVKSTHNLHIHKGNGSKFFGSNPGDMFYVARQLDDVDLLILVNAWDSRSFIGNGMAKDPTIDGFMVAGTASGRYWRNTSYLHQPLLHYTLHGH